MAHGSRVAFTRTKAKRSRITWFHSIVLPTDVAKGGAKVMSNIVRYLLERKEFYDRWVGTFTGFHSAPMTVLWGLDDPVAKVAMADRVKAWRPETDLYKLEGIGHWPSIEAPDIIAEAIIHRLPSE